VPGGLFPLFQVFAGLAGCQQFSIGPVTALMLFDTGKVKRVLIANLTGQSQTVCISGRISRGTPIELKPYALECLEGTA
jgi:hypothetical protein